MIDHMAGQTPSLAGPQRGPPQQLVDGPPEAPHAVRPWPEEAARAVEDSPNQLKGRRGTHPVVGGEAQALELFLEQGQQLVGSLFGSGKGAPYSA